MAPGREVFHIKEDQQVVAFENRIIGGASQNARSKLEIKCDQRRDLCFALVGFPPAFEFWKGLGAKAFIDTALVGKGLESGFGVIVRHLGERAATDKVASIHGLGVLMKSPEQTHQRAAFAIVWIHAGAPQLDDESWIIGDTRKIELRFRVESLGRLAGARKQAIRSDDGVAVFDEQVIAVVVKAVAVHAGAFGFRKTFAQLLIENTVAQSQSLFEFLGGRGKFDRETPAREAFFQGVEHAPYTRACPDLSQVLCAIKMRESPEIVTPYVLLQGAIHGMCQKVKRAVGVVGGSGYSGQELIDLLRWSRQDFELRERLTREDLLSDNVLVKKISGLEIVFLCTPNEISLELAPKILAAGVSVIDLSGAFRLKKHSYPEWYGFEHSAPDALARSEYALYPWVKPPALSQKPGPRLIANPGCYATAVEMTLLPLLRSKTIDATRIAIDAKSGASGAGRKPHVNLLFTEIASEFKPYKVGAHQHWPEIVETLETLAGEKTSPVFITELLPLERGISAAFFLEWHPSLSPEHRSARHLVKVLGEAYALDPSVEVGSGDEFATLRGVQKNNRLSIRATVAFGRPVVFATLDNLQRGAAGQALMNAYCLAGLDQPEFLL